MAPFGPAPEMVGNDTSFSAPVSRRKLSSAATASISVSLPVGASRSSQARKRAIAAPSRACAARAPAISAAFLHRLQQRDRIGARASTLPPALGRRSAPRPRRRSPGSSRTRLALGRARARSRGEFVAARARRRAPRARARTVVGELAAVDDRARAGRRCGTIAKASGSGVCGTSAPRMLNSPGDRSCGSETTSASARASRSRRGCASSLSRASSPASASRAAPPAPSGGGGPVGPDRVDRIGVDGDQLAPAAAQARRSCSALVRWCAATDRSRAWRPPAGCASSQLSRRRLAPGARSRTAVASTCVARLQRVAAVDEHRGRVRAARSPRAGRAGETGQPGQPLLASPAGIRSAAGRRGDDEAIEAAPLSSARKAATRAALSARALASSKVWKRASNMECPHSSAPRKPGNAGMPAPQGRIATSMVPDDWLSDAENGTSKGIWSDFVQRTNRLCDTTDRFSTIREFMLELRGFHAPLGIQIPTELFMLQCSSQGRI